MLPTRHRLTTRTEFTDAVRRGRRAGSGTVVGHLTRTPEPTDAPVQVGFVVSRAVGAAVVRNRVRRQLRHLARERLGRLPGGTVLVVRALPASAAASYADLGADLDRVLRRLGVSGQDGASGTVRSEGD